MSVSNYKMQKLEEKYGLKTSSQYEDIIISTLTSCGDVDKFAPDLAEKLNISQSEQSTTQKFFDKVIGSCGKRLVGYVDIVFWGCKSEYPLLEFYRRVMSYKDPAVWTLPNTISFVGDNREVMMRCEEMVKILFPMHIETKTIFTATDDYSDIEETLPPSSYIYPRIHFLLKNDFLHKGNSEAVTRTLQRLCARCFDDSNRKGYNEFFCGCIDIQEFVRHWKDAINVCGNIEIRNIKLQCEITGRPISIAIERELRRLGVSSQECLKVLVKLSRWSIRINDAECNFLDVFKYVEGGRDKSNERDIRYLVFYPKYESGIKICILKIGKFTLRPGSRFDDKLYIARHWLRSCAGKTADSWIDRHVRRFRYDNKFPDDRKYNVRELMNVVCVFAWNPKSFKIEISEFDQNYPERWDSSVPVDLRDMLGVIDNNTSPLPEVDAMQREIVYDRHKLRKIRGGPGTGKTVTMLWHGINALESKHLPVLVLTKTNTLSSANLKRFAVSYATKNNCDIDHVSGQIHFMTMARFLCLNAAKLLPESVDDSTNKCLRDKCYHCCREIAECHSEELDNYIREKCGRCEDFNDNAFHCKVKRNINENNEDWRLTESEKGICCDACFARLYDKLFKGEIDLSRLSDKDVLAGNDFKYGAVLVDEAQGLSADELQASYLITGAINRWREYYMFCDEEQRLRDGALEPDDQKPQFKIVRAPAVGFGRFVTLKNNHRVYSSELLGIYRQFQQLMSSEYDVTELTMQLPPGRVDLNAQMFSFAAPFEIERLPPIDIITEEHSGFKRIFDKIEQLKQRMNTDTLLVICDDAELLRDWYKQLSENNLWVLTHTENRDNRITERRMRLLFGEQRGKCHLTSIDCVQGQTFENVIYICTRGQPAIGEGLEEVFTGLTRARRMLRVLDCSEDAWLINVLQPIVNPNAPCIESLTSYIYIDKEFRTGDYILSIEKDNVIYHAHNKESADVVLKAIGGVLDQTTLIFENNKSNNGLEAKRLMIKFPLALTIKVNGDDNGVKLCTILKAELCKE